MDAKKEFGKRLQSLMLDRGWNQSELARRAGLGRDNISGYIRGKFFPNPTHLSRLRVALGEKDFERLGTHTLPQNVFAPLPEEESFAIKQIAGSPDWAQVTFSQKLTMKTALEIIALLTKK